MAYRKFFVRFRAKWPSVPAVLLEVHRLTNFNIVAGVMLIHVPTIGYTAGPTQTSTGAGTSTNPYMGQCDSRWTIIQPILLSSVSQKNAASSLARDRIVLGLAHALLADENGETPFIQQRC